MWVSEKRLRQIVFTAAASLLASKHFIFTSIKMPQTGLLLIAAWSLYFCTHYWLDWAMICCQNFQSYLPAAAASKSKHRFLTELLPAVVPFSLNDGKKKLSGGFNFRFWHCESRQPGADGKKKKKTAITRQPSGRQTSPHLRAGECQNMLGKQRAVSGAGSSQLRWDSNV